ncbi:MAG: ATP-dependent 6-phosphofructokinase [Spirochaetales bacterium]|nr:ATP-dependent 6-phosphofructokinase [Spirochaetales bacterium]
MKNINSYDFSVQNLGKATISSPIMMSKNTGDKFANYVNESESILHHIDANLATGETVVSSHINAVELAGPREKIYFNPAHVHASIVTCGGLCPGLNNVIRAVVRCFWYRYNVRRISGIQYGYRGLVAESPFEPIKLDPDVVDDIQMKGGTILGSSRGGGKKVAEIVDSLERMNINILVAVGGDGTLRGADEIGQEILKRGLKISVIGIPKTIDNDLSFIQSSFGFDTAVSTAVQAVRGAHVEAHDSINGVGLVKVMGRESGFIAAHTALAMSDVNFCLIPENPFDLEGKNGLLRHLRERILSRQHAVILIAEGAGQGLLEKSSGTLPEPSSRSIAKTDASGNKRLHDVGVFLKERIAEYFTKENIEVNIKYIDPSYIIRSAPANPNDSIYCSRLGAHAVHAAMSGRTRTLISLMHNRFVHIPIEIAVAERNYVDTEGSLWRDVLENTRQPVSMKNI